MCAKWNSEIDPNVAIKALKKIAFVNEEGNAAFRGFGIDPYLAIVESALDFDPDVSPALHTGMLRSAVFDAVRQNKLDAEGIKHLVSRREREHLKAPAQRYVLLTSISVKLPSYPMRTRIDGATLSFVQCCPSRFDRTSVIRKATRTVTGKLPTNYVWVKVGVSARGWAEAGEAGLRALDLLRAIWNLCVTFGRVRMTMSGRRPVNEIVLGPIHTLHYPDGKLASDMYWYEPSYRRPVRPFDLCSKLANVRAIERRIRRQLRAAKEGQAWSRALVRYVRAQDDPELENSFLSLWSLLETLTDTLKLSYDRTIRRAAFICRDREFAVQELKHLRMWRNRSVHLGESTDDQETHVYQLKSYVDRLLGFLLLNPDNRRRGHEQIARFLDLPYDSKTLRNTITLCRKALEYSTKKR